MTENEPTENQNEVRGKAASEEPLEDIRLFPDSSDFFGNKANFKTKSRKKMFRFSSQKNPRLTTIRQALNQEKKSDPGKMQKIRTELKILIKKYPNFADLHALKAIQAYRDVQQSGLTGQKFHVIEAMVGLLGRALNTQAYSLNNLSWFLKIYIHYLELLKKRLVLGYNVKGIKYSAAKRQLAVLHMQAKKGLKEFEVLYSKYAKTSFYAASITTQEIIEAHNAIRKGKDKTPIGKHNRPARVVQLIYMKVNMIISRIPIFSQLIQQNIEATNEVIHRDMFLLNGMIALNSLLNEFYMTKAKGDAEVEKKLLGMLIKKSDENLSYIQSNQELKKEFEYDPMLKFAIISLETANYDVARDYKEALLIKSRNHLYRIVKQSKSPNAIRLANHYIEKIEEKTDAIQADLLYKY